MKDNMLHKFAIRDLKTHKNDTIAIMATVMIISLIMMIISWLTPIFLNQRYLDYRMQYGTYTYYATFEKQEDLDKIKPIGAGKTYQLDDLDVCYQYHIGETLMGCQLVSLKGQTDMLSIQVREGRFPQNEDEIALPKSELERWGYDKNINQNIELGYISRNGSYKKTYHVVGLLEEAKEGFESSAVIQSKEDYTYGSVYIGNDVKVDNSEEIGLIQDMTFEEFQLTGLSKGIYIGVIELIIIIAGIVILYGITMAGFERKVKDYTLLRSIGITHRQMNYIILLQTLIISTIPAVFAMIFVFILSRFMTSYQGISLPFDLSVMIMQYMMILFISLLSYFTPARKSLRRSLTGAFDNQEHQYIYYRYKKIHQLNSFYLGYRQLIGFKRKSLTKLILLFVAVLFLSSYIYPYFYPSLQEIYHDTTNIKSYYSIDDEFGEVDIPKKEEINSYQPYTQKILYTEMIDEWTESIYPCNEEVKQYYQVDDLDKGEVYVSDAYLNDLYEGYHKGDVISICQQDFVIKDIIQNEEALCVIHEQDFLQIDDNDYSRSLLVKMDFENKTRRRQFLLEQYRNFGELRRENYAQYYIDNENLQDDEHTIQADMSDLLIGCMALFIFVYQYIFELFKQKEDIGSFQLLGMTKKEIGMIYFYKVFIVTFIAFMIATLYKLEDIHLSYQIDYVLKIFKFSVLFKPISLVLLVMIGVCLVSVMPIVMILNNSGLENKSIKD